MAELSSLVTAVAFVVSPDCGASAAPLDTVTATSALPLALALALALALPPSDT